MNLYFSTKALAMIGTILLCSEQIRADTYEDLVKKGDVSDQALDTPGALKYYQSADQLHPNIPSLLVKIARQFRHEMSDASNRKDKLILGNKALEYALRAKGFAPEDPETQLAVAITYGKLIPILSDNKKIEASFQMKQAADKALQLHPKHDADLAWHILGRWNRNMANLGLVSRAMVRLTYGQFPDATNETAVKCFEEAIKINSKRLMHYIELGRTYETMRRYSDASEWINKGLAMPNTEKDDPETKEMGEEALKEMGKEALKHIK